MTIRPMTREDLPAVARLSGELGYPVGVAEIARRFDALSDEDNGLFVAADSEGIVGWIHVFSPRTLTDESMAEIEALIVDEKTRSQGIGGQLVSVAESWAAQHGCRILRVRTRITRDRAHNFYRKSGFTLNKTQHVFDKTLHDR